MADITDIEATISAKIVGSDSAGVEQTPVQSTSSGGLHSNLRTSAGVEIGSVGDSLKTNVKINSDHLTSFGTLKTNTSHSVFESTFNYDKQPLTWDEVIATGGTNTWRTAINSIELATTTTSGSSVIVQSRKRIRYNPARTVAVQISAQIGALKTGTRIRLGQFDANNGLYFENTNVAKVVIRSNTSGAVVNTEVNQSAWNIDKLDGTGASGFTIDFSKQQLFIIEYGWQGIASVRFGFYVNGEIIYCHQFNNANSLTVPYMKTANLPIRIENTNTAATASVTNVNITCVAVKNFGEDKDDSGEVRTFVLPAIKTVSANPTFTPVMSIRLSAARIDGVVEILRAPLYGQTVDDVCWKVILNPTLTASTFATTSSGVQIDTAATALSGGTDVTSGFIKQGTDSGLDTLESFKYINTLLGSTQAGVADIITIAAASRATTADVWGSITWREF